MTEKVEKELYKVTFIILHYQLVEMTKQCVEIIKKVIKYDNYNVLVVDNASPNGSGKVLQELYAKDKRVDVILNCQNWGFSKGNNQGYKVARDNGADFIIIMNNDVEIQQSDFIQRIIRTYEDTKCYVLGPDIVNLEGIHQSPERNYFISKTELKKWYIKRKMLLHLLLFANKLNIEHSVVYRRYVKYDKNRILNLAYSEPKENVELQGACFIFTPDFIKMREIAFEEISFMYAEEPMLACLCKKNGWKTYYDPQIKVLHREKFTTHNLEENYLKHEIFHTQNLVIGLRKIIRKMNEWGLE